MARAPRAKRKEPQMPFLLSRHFLIPASIIIGLVSLVILLRNFQPQEVLGEFAYTKVWMIAIYLAAVALMMVVFTWRWQVILASQGHHHISFKHLFWYKVVSYGVSYVTPSTKLGGEAVRAGDTTAFGAAALRRANAEESTGLLAAVDAELPFTMRLS
jgi:uncharacterized membrane protein YbhN (UPF0104 family)